MINKWVYVYMQLQLPEVELFDARLDTYIKSNSTIPT